MNVGLYISLNGGLSGQRKGGDDRREDLEYSRNGS